MITIIEAIEFAKKFALNFIKEYFEWALIIFFIIFLIVEVAVIVEIFRALYKITKCQTRYYIEKFKKFKKEVDGYDC